MYPLSDHIVWEMRKWNFDSVAVFTSKMRGIEGTETQQLHTCSNTGDVFPFTKVVRYFNNTILRFRVLTFTLYVLIPIVRVVLQQSFFAFSIWMVCRRRKQ